MTPSKRSKTAFPDEVLNVSLGVLLTVKFEFFGFNATFELSGIGTGRRDTMTI